MSDVGEKQAGLQYSHLANIGRSEARYEGFADIGKKPELTIPEG